MSITLTQTIGATTMDATSGGLPGASPGIALRFHLYDGPVAFYAHPPGGVLAARPDPEPPGAVASGQALVGTR